MRVERERRHALYYGELGKHHWPTQRLVLDNVEDNFIMLAGGIGAGKSLTAADYLLPELFWPNAHYWIVAPTFELARMEFEYVVGDCRRLGLSFARGPNQPQDGEWYFQLMNGTDVTTKSATRPDGLHAVPVAGIIAAEAGLMTEWLVLHRLLPRVLRLPGGPGWIVFAGTFEGSNAWLTMRFWDVLADMELPREQRKFVGWAAYSMPSWENLDVYPGGRNDAQIKMAEANMTPEEFQQRFGAVPMTPAGVVLKEFSATRHVSEAAEFDERYGVQIWVDPGRTYAVLAVQIIDGVVRIIDEVYLFDGSTEQAIREAVRRPWWSNVQGGWIDVEAAEARDLWQNGAIWRTLTQQMDRPLCGVSLGGVRVAIDMGIERVRTLLHSKVIPPDNTLPVWQYAGQDGVSRIIIHPRCQNTIREAALYCYPRDRVTDGSKPIDKYNHAWKAIAYGCVGNFGYQAPYVYRLDGMRRRPVYGLTR